MITLSHLQPFAGGQKRDCYFHPEDPEKIIKVIPPNKSPDILLSQKNWLRRLLQSPTSLDANRSESKKFERLAKKLGNLKERMPHIVEYFGKTATDLGEGLVFQAVRNHDGRISENVYRASQSGGYHRSTLLEALQHMEEIPNDASLYNDVGQNNIVVQILSPDHQRYKLWIVDGINCGPYIPISEYWQLYAQVRKYKKLQRLRRFIEHNF